MHKFARYFLALFATAILGIMVASSVPPAQAADYTATSALSRNANNANKAYTLEYTVTGTYTSAGTAVIFDIPTKYKDIYLYIDTNGTNPDLDSWKFYAKTPSGDWVGVNATSNSTGSSKATAHVVFGFTSFPYEGLKAAASGTVNATAKFTARAYEF